MKIFLIRHAESYINKREFEYLNSNNIVDRDCPITSNGLIQADKLGLSLLNYCINNNINLSNSKMYVSTYKRTKQTAECINKHLCITDVEYSDEITEYSMGKYNFSKSDVEVRREFLKKVNDKTIDISMLDDKLSGGETFREKTLKMRNFFDKIEKESFDNIFIVSHALALSLLIVDLFSLNINELKDNSLKNCEVLLIDNISGYSKSKIRIDING